MSLRDEIAEIVRQMRPASERADAILAIPELADALAFYNGPSGGGQRAINAKCRQM